MKEPSEVQSTVVLPGPLERPAHVITVEANIHTPVLAEEGPNAAAIHKLPGRTGAGETG